MKQKIRALFILTFVTALFMSVTVFADLPTDSWLRDWRYAVVLDDPTFGDCIYLYGYIGTSGDAVIYGKATSEGQTYPVIISVEYDPETMLYVTGFNSEDSIVNLRFVSVDGQKVQYQRKERFDDAFYGMTKLETITFGGNFEGGDYISQAISMFEDCRSLKSVDVETIDFKQAVNLGSMFTNCSSLKQVTLNFANAANTRCMFKGCSDLEKVKISGSSSGSLFSDQMFKDCTSLKEADFSDFDSSGLYYVKNMFENCISLKEFDLTSLDLSDVTDFSDMFSGCSFLKSIDLSEIDSRSKSCTFTRMFAYCHALKEIKISENLDIPDNPEKMFWASSPTETKIIGTPSDSFVRNVLGNFKAWNRYIGTVDVTARTELTGKPLEAGEFGYILTLPEGQLTLQNDILGNISVTGCRIYCPGETTFTIGEGISRYNAAENRVEVYELSTDSRYSCENPTLTKTVNIVLNPDGSITAEDI